jgi:hypothetical protein
MKAFLMIIALAAAALAQNEKPQAKPREPGLMKFIELKYLDGDRLARVSNFARELYLGKAYIVHAPSPKTLAIRADTESDLDAVEAMVRKFDVPQAESRTRNIDVTVYLLEPVDQPPPASQQIPQDLSSTVAQLRNLFGHKYLRLVETTLLSGREGGKISATGILATASNPPASYEAKMSHMGYSEAEKSVFINEFGYTIRVGNMPVSAVQSNITVKEGQKLVIGKVSKDQNEPGAFLVVTAKVN